FLRLRALQRSTPFPYTTLFRSRFGGWVGGRLSAPGRSGERGGRGCRGDALGSGPGREQPPHHLLQHFDPPLESLERVVLQRLERSEEHTSELQSRGHLVCRLLL